jgi:histidinol dehydrogenase
MRIIRYPGKKDRPELLKRPVMDNRSVDSIVIPVIEDVRKRGDKAVIEYTNKFDKVTLSDLEVSFEEFASAERLVDNELKKAIETASRNIEGFHRMQPKVLNAGRKLWLFKRWVCTFPAALPPCFPPF